MVSAYTCYLVPVTLCVVLLPVQLTANLKVGVPFNAALDYTL